MGRKFLIYFLIANLYFLAGNIPLIISYFRTPLNTVFPLIHSDSSYDYHVYLSVINEGQNGFWLFKDHFTSDDTKPGIFYLYYIFLGKISSIFRLWPPLVYHLARIVSVEIFLVAVFLLMRLLLPNRLSFPAAVAAIISTLPPLYFFRQPDAFSTFTPWWSFLEAISRLDGLPHHIFGQAMLLISLIYFLKFFKAKEKKFLLLASVTAVISGIVLPPALFPVVIGLPLTFTAASLYQFIKYKKITVDKTVTAPFIIYWLSSLIPLALSAWQTRQGYPWILWQTWEVSRWNVQETAFNRHLLTSFSLLSIISIPAIIHIFKKNDWPKIFVVFWAATPIVMLPFVNLVSIGKIRLITAAPFVPWSVLAAVSFGLLFAGLRKKSLSYLTVAAFILLNWSVTIPLLIQKIKTSRRFPLYSNFFIPQKNWNSITYIKDNLPAGSIILSNEYVGNIIPAYTPSISYFGHINQTLDFAKKQGNVWLFYTRNISDSEALNFLEQNNISYIFYGEDEVMLGKSKIDYPFLEKIYDRDGIFIFKFENPS